VLVVGLGNSAFEVALNCVESGADVQLLGRGEQHVISMSTMSKFMKLASLLGMDATPSNLQKRFYYTQNDPQFHDEIKKLDGVVSWMSTNLSSYGIKTPSIGPFSRSFYLARIPTYDWGLIPHIQSGKVKVLQGTLLKFTEDGVELLMSEGNQKSCEKYDVVIFGTGYRHGLQELFTTELCEVLLTDEMPKGSPPYANFPEKFPKTDGRGLSTVIDSLYFGGFDVGTFGGLCWGIYSWHIGEQICIKLGYLKPEDKSIKTEAPKSWSLWNLF
jgi:lysine/ornithine N-monooxygenase